jgi:hypothetical protein
MPQGRTGKINYRCPQCLFRDVDYDLLFDRDLDQFYCRRCNWEGDEHEILQLYSVYKRRYKAMLKRFTVEDILRDE